jgi:protein-S-isoprenylcysteine O-methyltransferase Ste14
MVALLLFSLLIVINVSHLLGDADESPTSFGAWLSSALTLVFYLLLVFAYFRRTKSTSTDRNWKAWLFALTATASPFLIPLVGGARRQDGLATLVSSEVLIIGLTFMIWSLSYLGTNISVVPQARRVVTTGPYAWVRHPLYAAELINVVGVCLAFTSPWPWLVLVSLAVLQFLRARREEALLSQVLGGYADYRDRTPMLLPRPPRQASKRPDRPHGMPVP